MARSRDSNGVAIVIATTRHHHCHRRRHHHHPHYRHLSCHRRGSGSSSSQHTLLLHHTAPGSVRGGSRAMAGPGGERGVGWGVDHNGQPQSQVSEGGDGCTLKEDLEVRRGMGQTKPAGVHPSPLLSPPLLGIPSICSP